MKPYRIILIAGLVTLSALACKKDESSTTTSKSLTGTLTLTSIDAYSNPGDSYTIEASGLGLAASETDTSIEIKYVFKVGSEAADTTNKEIVTIPDTLGTYTITVTAYATGYYQRSSTLTTMVVSDKSVTELDREGDPDFTDPRDSKEYFTVEAGGLTWFAQNLAYFEKDAEGNYTLGRPYASARATEDVMGGFYNWSDAQAACPSGWRLPTAAEFDALGSAAGALMVDAYFHGERMWEFWPGVNVTNSTGLGLLPFGYATIVDDVYTFYGYGDYCYYWVDNAGSPMCRSIYVEDADVKSWGSPSATDFAAQVRCVK